MKNVTLFVSTAGLALVLSMSSGVNAQSARQAPDRHAAQSTDADAANNTPAPSNRSVLPVPPAPFTGKIGKTYKDSVPAFPKPIKPPAGAPNVLVVMTDDVGYGAASTFGGPIPTPNLSQLAKRGVVYNNFHVTAMCSPTRAALLTGRNHHAVGNGTVANLSTGFPGYWSIIPNSAATVADILKDNGYNTAMFGKHHNTPKTDVSAAGPYDLWPLGLGFEHFFGFMAADTNQFTPALYRDNSPIPTLHGEVLDKALADEAIDYIHNQKAAAPDKPFFVYYATGTAHAPNQAPRAWIDKFKGQFDAGWDAIRAATVKRQIAKGIVPPGTDVTPRPAAIKAWQDLTPDERKVNARMMAVYAAQLAYQDHQFGRIVDELDRMGIADNTLIIFIEGDNGAAAEAGPNGSLNPMAVFANGMKDNVANKLAALDKMGGPDSILGIAHGWAWATDAPFPLFKEYASHLGGTTNGMVVSWPGHIHKHGMRSQFTHVTDIMPTILKAAHIKQPSVVNGTKQQPVDGVSFAYSFNAPKAPSRHKTQYFEMLGNRAIYHDGWLANTYPGRLPWKPEPAGELPTDYKWQLYDLDHDFAQAHNIAAKHPDKLKSMQALFDKQARKNKVYPLDDRLNMARFMASSKNGQKRNHYTYWGGGISIPPATAPPMLDRSFILTADLDLPEKASGTVLALGSHFGGWSLHFEEGRPVAVMAASQLPGEQFSVTASKPLPAGKTRLTYDFRYDGGINSGGEMIISADGHEVARGRIARTISKLPEQIATFDIGFDRATKVVPGIGSKPFTGKIKKVDINLGKAGRPGPIPNAHGKASRADNPSANKPPHPETAKADRAKVAPNNPYVADSVYPMPHGDPAQQDATKRAGPLDRTRTLTPDEIQYAHLGPGYIGAYVSGRYPDGRRVLWANGVNGLYKLDYDSYKIIDHVPTPQANKYTRQMAEKLTAKLNRNNGPKAIPVAVKITRMLKDLSGIYIVIGRNNWVYIAGRDGSITAYSDKVKGDPDSKIVVKARFKMPSGIGGLTAGMNITYDGWIILPTEDGHLVAVSMDLSKYRTIALRNPDNEDKSSQGTGYGWVRNSVAVDKQGGIYVVSRNHMHKVIWTGDHFSTDPADGAWVAQYDDDTGKGSGATPSLMGFGHEDKFVVITDGDKLMNMTLFWRDTIPNNWKQRPNAPSRRIAGMTPVTMGPLKLKAIQSEQSVIVAGYGALVVNNMPRNWPGFLPKGDPHARGLLIGPLGSNPAFQPHGVEKFSWDPMHRTLSSAWVNAKVSSPNGVPWVSLGSNQVYFIGARNNKWTLEALNWNTGASTFHYVLGGQKYNSEFSSPIVDENGGIFWGTTWGRARIKSSTIQSIQNTKH